MWSAPLRPEIPSTGTKDGTGAGDHDQPYRFGWKPRVGGTFPFSERQYARLLVLKSQYQARLAEEPQLNVAC